MEWLKKIRRRWHSDIAQWNEELKDALEVIRGQTDRQTDLPSEPLHQPKFQLFGSVGPNFQNYGKNTYFGVPCRIWHLDTQIGAFCSISWDVNIGTTYHPLNWLSTHPFTYNNHLPDLFDITVPGKDLKDFFGATPVTIGNDVWVGCDVTILDGVHIGDGAVIGAGSIVTKDVPPYAVVAGAPAKVIKYRFDEGTIEELEKLKWWELDDSVIATLPFDDISACIETLKKIRSCLGDLSTKAV